MCKLFVAYQCANVKSLLVKHLHNKENPKYLECGYAVSWFQQKHWNTYKCNCAFATDNKSNENIDNIQSQTIISHVRSIRNKEMTNTELKNQIVIENVHPFQYKQNQLIHHGDLFINIDGQNSPYQISNSTNEFKIAVSNIMQHIDKKLQKQIKGTTDSEILFYLLLSIQNGLSSTSTPNTDADVIVQSFYIMNKIIKNTSIENSSSICFTNDKYIAVANIYKNNSGKFIKRVSLYMDDNDGIVFCNAKITPKSVRVDENTLYLINIQTGDMRVYKL